MRVVLNLLGAALVAGSLSACGDDGDRGATTAGDRPRIVVSTTILGDVVGEVVGDAADVEVVMPPGADPHEFAVSSRQAEAMEEADLLVVNGAGFEEGLAGVVEAAEDRGAEVFAFTDHVELLPVDGERDDEAEHEGEDEEEHGHEGGDPHFWTDPLRMAAAVEALGARVGELPGIDGAAVAARADAYVAELEALDAEITGLLEGVPDAERVLVTNHEVLGYFADRYGFEVIGAVIPSLTTNAQASAADVEALAELVADEGVPAIFGETTRSTELAEALADAAGTEVEIVELFTESLGEPGSGAETYVEMLRTDAELIADALA